MKILFFLFTITLFLGCETLTPTYPKNTATKKNVIISDMMRGIILSQHFIKNKNTWNYRLEVMDMANENLRYFNFVYTKKLYDVGDLIYVIFDKKDKKKIQNLYLITKAYMQKNNKDQLKKRTESQKTPWINPPKTETIKLN